MLLNELVVIMSPSTKESLRLYKLLTVSTHVTFSLPQILFQLLRHIIIIAIDGCVIGFKVYFVKILNGCNSVSAFTYKVN